jgi:serine/threonine-protein kinase RsbW
MVSSHGHKEPGGANETHANFKVSYGSLDALRQFISQSAAVCGLGAADIYAVQMAVDEAFSNIVEHAYGGESPDIVECSCQIGADRLTIQLKDWGRPFDPSQVPEPDIAAGLEEREQGGLGLYFMRHLMDEVHFAYHRNPGEKEGCNLLTMVKLKEQARE